MEMKYLPLLLLLTAAARAADGPAAAPSGPPQATVTNPVKETALTTVTLTPEAAKRLGIATTPVERKVIRQERLYSGEITLPLASGGANEALAALAPPQNAVELLKLAELQITADGELAQAKVKMEAARLTLDRAGKLLASQTGSERTAEEAQAAHSLASAAWQQAVARRALLGPGIAPSPESTRWWIRVALPAADAPLLDAMAAASVLPAGLKTSLPAKPVNGAPPTASGINATVDWYFELEDPRHLRRPGECVGVRIPSTGAGDERLTAPWAGVLHDIHGGQWVYEMTAPETFARRRVQVARVAGADAVLATGPAPGAKIVTSGAAELFGIEFGPGK